MQAKTFYTTFHVVRHGAIWNFIKGARNLGKTTAFLIRAKRRFCRKGYTTLWLRRFKEEKQKAQSELFKKAKTLKLCGLTEKTFRWNGYEAQILIKDKWRTFLRVGALTQWADLRSADDGKTETIVFDEYSTTPERYARYLGNEVENLIDIVATMKREHGIHVYFLGNKEYPIDPYFAYFGIKIPDDFRGIRMFKNNSILVEVNDDIPDEIAASYAGKWTDSLKDTPYGNYLFNGEYKTGTGKTDKLPRNAVYLFQFDFNGAVSIFTADGYLFASSTCDKTRLIFTDKPRHYPNQQIIRPSDRFYFNTLIYSYKLNLIKYTDNAAINALLPVLKILGLK